MEIWNESVPLCMCVIGKTIDHHGQLCYLPCFHGNFADWQLPWQLHSATTCLLSIRPAILGLLTGLSACVRCACQSVQTLVVAGKHLFPPFTLSSLSAFLKVRFGQSHILLDLHLHSHLYAWHMFFFFFFFAKWEVIFNIGDIQTPLFVLASSICFSVLFECSFSVMLEWRYVG